MINPKDMGWLLNMKLLLCNELCLMLVLTYVLMHKRVFALVIELLIQCYTVIQWSYKHYLYHLDAVLLSLCSWNKVQMSGRPLACKDRQHLACRMAVTAGGYGQEQEWMGSQWMSPFRAQSWKGTIVICMPSQLHPMTWCAEPFGWTQAQTKGLGYAPISLPVASCEQGLKVHGWSALPCRPSHWWQGTLSAGLTRVMKTVSWYKTLRDPQ